jgi:hypothetical protein
MALMRQAKLAIIGIISLGFGILSNVAQADPIVGSVEFFGSATPSGASSGFPVTVHFNDAWHTLSGDGIYAGVPFATAATFNDFDFTGDGATAALFGPPIAPLWSFSFNGVDYSFDLQVLTNGHTEAGSMSFTGTGIAHATGFDDTPGAWALQGAGNSFSFQISTSTTTSVPEADINILLFLGSTVMAVTVILKECRKT